MHETKDHLSGIHNRGTREKNWIEKEQDEEDEEDPHKVFIQITRREISGVGSWRVR